MYWKFGIVITIKIIDNKNRITLLINCNTHIRETENNRTRYKQNGYQKVIVIKINSVALLRHTIQ